MVETLHLLNGCLIIPASLAIAIALFIQHWRGRGITPPSFAAIFVVSLLIFAQIYMGITLLGNRGQRSMLHFSLGALPILLVVITLWLLPQTRARPALTAGIGFTMAGVLAAAAFFIG